MTPAPLVPYRPGPIEGVSEEVQACIPPSGALHVYVWWASQTTHAPAWWHVAAGLAALAHEAARQGYVIGAQALKPILWVSLLGPSAAGKSTAINRLLDFYGAYLDGVRGRKTFVMAEGSIPGVFEKLTEGWDDELERTLGLMHQDEFSRLLDRRDTVAEMLCQLADGRDIERHKVSTRAAARQGQATNDELRNPTISAMFATTYSNLRRVTHGHHLEGGLYSRLLWFVANPDPAKLKVFPDPHPNERRAALGVWSEWNRWFMSCEGAGHPKIVEVPQQVHYILEESLFETARRRLSDDDRLNATRVRAINAAYLIAGLYALSQGQLQVLSEHMDYAVNLVEKCTAGLERVDPELGGTEIMQLTNLAFRAIQGRGTGGMKRNELYGVLKSNRRTIDEVVNTLIDEGSVRQERVKTGKPGRPPIRYIACGPQRYLSEVDGGAVEALRKSDGSA